MRNKHSQVTSLITRARGGRSKQTLLLAIVFAVWVSPSLATRRERLIESWKPVHYSVRITFNDRLEAITRAQTEITITSLKDNLSTIDLDFGALTIDAVQVNDQTARYEHYDQLLRVSLLKPVAKATRLVISIAYHGKPSDGLILTKDKDGKASAVGDNWPNRVHHWIPSLDHPSAKATVNFTVTAPKRDSVVANGRLNRVQTNSPASRTWSYSEAVPIPPYCMIVAVGEFSRLEAKNSSTVPVSYWVPYSDRKSAPPGFAPAAPAIKLFSETVAPYPYEKLALIVGATQFGGMENSSAIVFPGTLFARNATPQPMSRAFQIPEQTVSVVAHEIAHQWFGDSVTESTWSDLWLSEGFATYFAGLFIQRYEGEATFRKYMQDAAENYLQYEKQVRIPIHDTETEDLFKLLNANNYQKGSWVLHMLRSELGDQAFFRGLRDYYKRHQNSTASTEDLRRALEQSSGFDLLQFFARWVYGTGHPQYDLSWKWSSDRKTVQFNLRQLQPEPFFPNSLPLDVITAQGKQRIVLKPTSKETSQELKVDQAATAVVLDPDDTVLKEATVKAMANLTNPQ